MKEYKIIYTTRMIGIGMTPPATEGLTIIQANNGEEAIEKFYEKYDPELPVGLERDYVYKLKDITLL